MSMANVIIAGDIYTCWECSQPMPKDYTPDMCCDGYMCGCQGGPVDPVCCTNICEQKWLATVFGEKA